MEVGRPIEWTNEKIEVAKAKIIEGLYDGLSLKKILDTDKQNGKNIPDRSTVYTWLNDVHKDYDKEFFNNYTRVREDSADIDVDKMEDLNQEIRDKKIDPQSARVIADNLKWTAGRKKPKKYGDKLGLEHSGEIKTKQPDLSGLSEKTLKQVEKELNKNADNS